MNANIPDSPRAAMIVLGIALICAVTVTWLRTDTAAHASGTSARGSLLVTSNSFADGAQVPEKFTCDGQDVSPALAWSALPPGTQSVAIVMDDPDAPMPFVHWMAYDLPAGTQALAEGASSHLPDGAKEGENSFGHLGYGGPCPPPGKPHHYVFRIYALDSRVQLPSGANKRQLAAAMEHHVIAEGKITGLYSRTGTSQ